MVTSKASDDPDLVEVVGDTTATTSVANEEKPTSNKDKLSEPLRRMAADEDNSLASFLRTLGLEEGSFRIELHRMDPETAWDPTTGRNIKVNGHLKRYDELIDESFIQERHGGGRMRIRIMKQTPKGSFVFMKSKDFNIAGEPKIDALRNIGAPGATKSESNGESPSIVKEVMGMMKDEVAYHRERADKPTMSTTSDAGTLEAMRMAMAPLEAQLLSLTQQLVAKDRMLADMQNRPPPKDEFKDTLLTNLMTKSGDQVQATRIAYEAEIRAIKEGHAQQESRIRDSFDRDKQYITMQHERELTSLRTSHEIALSSVKSSSDLQVKMLENSNRSLEREIDHLRTEVKDLRAKKDKSVVEMVKDLAVIKDAIGGDEEETKSGWGKLVDVVSDPNAIQAIGSVIRGPAPAQPQAVVQQQPQNTAPQIIRGPDGEKYALRMVNGKQVLTGPLKRKKKPPVVNADGTVEPELPEIDQATVDRVVQILENAFQGGQQADIVAQSFAVHIPEEVKIALRDHGVDVFMAKVAKLHSSSPLSSQAGKNWLRKLAESLGG